MRVATRLREERRFAGAWQLGSDARARSGTVAMPPLGEVAKLTPSGRTYRRTSHRSRLFRFLRERAAMSAPCPYCHRRYGDHVECREAVIRRGDELRARSVLLLERAARVRHGFQTVRRSV